MDDGTPPRDGLADAESFRISRMFVVEDEWHAEHIGEFASRAEANAEVRRLAGLPWDQVPNLCPCMSWSTCGRRYHVAEYDVSSTPWRMVSDEALLDVSAKGIVWLSRCEEGGEG